MPAANSSSPPISTHFMLILPEPDSPPTTPEVIIIASDWVPITRPAATAVRPSTDW